MYRDERIRKTVFDTIVEEMSYDNTDYRSIIEMVSLVICDQYNLILTQKDAEFLVDSMWDDAADYVEKQNRTAEDDFYERQGALADAMAGRW